MLSTPCYFDARRFRIRLYEIGCKSLADLARLSGYSKSLIEQVARGRIPSPPARTIIAAALRTTPDDLWPLVPAPPGCR